MESSVQNAITISLVGFGVVFTCLTFFALMIAFLNSTDRKIIAYKKRKIEATKNAIKNNTPISEGVEDDIVPVIIAAAYSALSQPIVVRKIVFVAETNIDSDWSRISRASSIATHNIRRRGV